MKNVMKRSFAVLMTLVMCASMFFGLTFSAQAAETPTVNYVYDGSYVYNWGERGTKAEFLSPMAIEFYSANGTTLDGLLALDGSASESGVPSSALFGELHELMESNHDYITSYNATKNLFQYTDCQNSGGKISSFYSGTAIGPSWDGAWNREHVWPNSKGDEAGNGENDLMMLRPTSTSENSSRGNKAYGTATTTSYYNPNDEGGGAYDLRGDVARIILYQYVRWECTNTGSSYNSSSIFGSDGVIESQDVLLDWIEADPVDTWEMGRNDAAESILGTRNVFVDYPELAFDLFNEAVPTDYTSPSDGTSVEGDTSGGTGDDTTGEDVVAPETATYVFSNYTAGTQYANESLVLDDIVTATSYNSNCHFTTQLRMYNSNTTKSGGMVILSSKSEISSISLNAGYKATSLAIYSSSDGSTWSSPTSLTLTTSYKDFSVDLPAGTKYVKIENSGTAQARIASITLTFAATSNDDTSDDKVYVDSNGVIVSGSADAFPEDTTITVTPITSGDAFDTATSALSGIASKFMAYDVTPSATLNEGSVVKLTLDIPDGYDADHVCIAHIDENGVVELLSSEIDKTANTVSAEVEHFSTYAVVDTSEASSEGGSTEAEEVTATIDFTTTTQRVSQTTAQQVWANDGLTFINDKASSTTNVADYSNPVRIYANSSVEIKYDGGKIKKIVIDGTSSNVNNAQITAWKTSIDNLGDSNISTSLSSKVVTVEFATEVDSLVITSLSAQARAMYITATVLKTSTGGDSTSPKITATANNKSYGTVEVSDKYITATPATGYEVSGYEIVSGNTNATVTQSGNNFTVKTDADVTIQINFVARTQYTVTFSDLGTTSTVTAYSGDTITLPTLSGTDYTAVGWVAAQIDGETTDKPTVYNAGATYTVMANTTLYALYSRTEAGGSGESDVFAKYTGEITEGDYLIVYSGYAMQAGVSSNRFTQSAVTDNGGSIISPDASLIWTVTADGDYYTLYNESTAKYAAGNGTKNQGKLADTVDDYARWSASGTDTYELVNKGNAAKSVNANLRRNGTYGFACYGTTTGGALTLYKRTAAAMTTYYFTDAGEQVTYTITANANIAEWGTVSVSGTTVSATPNAGYTVSGYEIVSGNTNATVTQEGNTFFVTATSDVVITINFEALPTYTVTFVEGSTTASTDSTYSGGQITLPEHTGTLDEYTTFNGWAVAQNETDAAKIFAAGSKYYVTANIILYAQYTVTIPPVTESSSHYFVKVTEQLDDFTGVYLIVNEGSSVAFNGGITDNLDVAGNNLGVTISNDKIAATSNTMAMVFIITKNTNGTYNIRSQSGFNIGCLSDANSLLYKEDYYNNISIDADGNAVIQGQGGAYLRYNKDSGQYRFRYYKTSSYTGQQPIALYKLDVANISGAQVTVGADLTMKYYVDVTNIENVNSGDLTMRFSIDGEVIDTVSGTVVGSQYVFDFAGLAPQRMADIIKAEVLFKGNLIDVKDNYSIKANAQNLLDANTNNTELTQFITDMLYYGDAAQKYTKYNTDNLATSGVKGLGTPLDEPLTEDYSVFNLTETTGDAGFRSASVWFDVTNRLIVKVSKKTEDVNVKIYVTPFGETKTELTYNSDVGGYMTDEIKVTGFNTSYTFELCGESDNVIQTLTYSINSYAYSKYQSSNNPNMASLALALFRLGQSAENL